MNKKVVILGCGPAGMLAAHAATRAGHEPIIVSKVKQQSVISGAQFIHERIPGVLTNPSWCSITKLGSQRVYARKIYGTGNAECSWDRYPKTPIKIWPMNKVYDQLWSRYSQFIQVLEINNSTIRNLLEDAQLMVSTIPLPAIVKNKADYHFKSKQAWVAMQDHVADRHGDNFIVWNGNNETAYYRSSRLFGHASWEFGFRPFVENPSPGHTVHKIIKPLGYQGDVHVQERFGANLILAGRFGTWSKKTLAHEAFFDTQERLAND